MTLTESNGSTATTASEATISEITSDDLAYWGGYVFIPTTFVSGDRMEIRFYVWQSNATASLQCVYMVPVVGTSGTVEERAIYLPPVATKRYRLTFKRTFGIDRTFKWQIVKQTG